MTIMTDTELHGFFPIEFHPPYNNHPWLEEVRYRKPVKAKYVGSYTYTPKDREKFNSLYELLSEDYAPNIHEERLLIKNTKDIGSYLKQKLPQSTRPVRLNGTQIKLINHLKRKTHSGINKM